jgi:hypothetical protein
MAGNRYALILVLPIVPGIACSAIAQGKTAPPAAKVVETAPAAKVQQMEPAAPAPLKKDSAAKPAPRHRATKAAPWDNPLHRKFERLPGERKKQFKKNLKRWKHMSPAERQKLRAQMERRRARIIREAGQALRHTGLQLDKERKKQFIRRYHQERKKVERKLWKEMADKRRDLMKHVVARLVKEFSAKAEKPAPADKPAQHMEAAQPASHQAKPAVSTDQAKP